MKPLRLICCLTLLFFLLMAAVTVYAVGREYNSLPRVSLTAAAPEENGLYRVPLSALHTGGEGERFLFQVVERDGPWGKEYRLKKVPLGRPRPGPEPGTVLVPGRQLSDHPLVAAGEGPLQDGQRVRFYREVL